MFDEYLQGGYLTFSKNKCPEGEERINGNLAPAITHVLKLRKAYTDDTCY